MYKIVAVWQAAGIFPVGSRLFMAGYDRLFLVMKKENCMKKTISAICGLMAAVCATVSIPSINAFAGEADKNVDYYTGIMDEFRTYEGYLDQCKGWSGYKGYVNKDYDGDKKTDRVKRSYNEDYGTATYSIEFGNGDVAYFFNSYYDTSVPFIEGVDLTSDGKNEIIFEAVALMSTSLPNTAADITVITKDSSDSYVTIPIDNEEINVCVEQSGKYTVTLSSFYPEFSQKLNIGIENWENNPIYAEYDDEAITCVAWDYEIVKSGKNVMKLYYHLFDKWSPYGMVVTMKYEKGILHADSSAKVVIDDKDFDRINPDYGY